MERPGIGSNTFKIKFDSNWLSNASVMTPLLDVKIESIYTEIATKDCIAICIVNGAEKKMYVDKTIINDLLDY